MLHQNKGVTKTICVARITRKTGTYKRGDVTAGLENDWSRRKSDSRRASSVLCQSQSPFAQAQKGCLCASLPNSAFSDFTLVV